VRGLASPPVSGTWTPLPFARDGEGVKSNFRTVAHVTAAKPQKTAGYRSRRRFVVLKITALLEGFRLDRLDDGMLAFTAEESISLRWTPNQGRVTIFARWPLQNSPTSLKRCGA
jgi:hypothetical protein